MDLDEVYGDAQARMRAHGNGAGLKRKKRRGEGNKSSKMGLYGHGELSRAVGKLVQAGPPPY